MSSRFLCRLRRFVKSAIFGDQMIALLFMMNSASTSMDGRLSPLLSIPNELVEMIATFSDDTFPKSVHCASSVSLADSFEIKLALSSLNGFSQNHSS